MNFTSDACYMPEKVINPLLNCSICSKPFVEPVINDDNKVYCRACISSDGVRPLTEALILAMLDDLRVECLKCQEKNIRRINYDQHKNNQCPQRIVLCKAADLKCPWTGKYIELEQHLQICPFEILRPVFTEIFLSLNKRGNDQQPDEYRKECEELKNEVEHLRTQRIELQNAIYQIANQAVINTSNQNDELNRLYQEQVKRTNELEGEIQRLRRLFLQQVPLWNKFQTEFEQFKQSIKQNNEIEQLKEQFEQLQIEIKSLSEQMLTIPPPPPPSVDNSTEITYMKQLLDQHDVQIKLLARKKCVIPAVSSHVNLDLETMIDQFVNNSDINLDGKQLGDIDMDIVCKKAIIEKKSSKLRLQRNKITGKGATVLANSLYNNTNLIELYLSKNQISDIGVHALAQTFAVNNSTLKILDLYSNNITDDGIEYLAEMLKINKSITRLGLGINQITDHGVRLITNAIIYFNEHLQYLALPSNKLITDKSVPFLIEMLKNNSSLNTLWLNNCSLSPTAIVQLKEAANAKENFTLEV